MILTAHQPVYLPWLGLFHKIYLADVFCYFDIVQYQKKDFNNRNQIKTQNGATWLSVPVESKNHLKKNVGDIKIIPGNWIKKHLKSIELAYKKSEFYKNYKEEFENIYKEEEIKTLSQLNLKILKFLLRKLKVEKKIIIASEYNFKGAKSDLVLDMCVSLKATKYIFGSQGINYVDQNKFKNNNVEIFFQDFKHPKYKQLNGNFLPYMSVIDLLFNEGEKSLEKILQNNIKKI